MIGYIVTTGTCLFLLAMIPIWSNHSEQPTYPLAVILLLAAVVVLVPLLLRGDRKR
jgi:hypothetical protein